MLKNLIAALTVIVLSIGICAFSMGWTEKVTEEIDAMRVDVVKMAEAGDVEGAQAKLGQMAECWSRHERVMEVLASHEQLHEIAELIVEGDANLSAGDRDDFARSMALLGEAVRHLYEEERLTLTNVL